MATVTSLKKSAELPPDPISVARVELQAAIERRRDADAALATIRAAEKQSSRSRWAAKAAVEKLSKADDDFDVSDELVADLAAGKSIDISAPVGDRATALEKARGEVAEWEAVGVSLRTKAAAAQDEVHWSNVALERSRDRVITAIGADLLPNLLQERARLLKSLAPIDGVVAAFRGRVDGDALAMLEAGDREAELANKARHRVAPGWQAFAEQLLGDAYAPPPKADERSR